MSSKDIKFRDVTCFQKEGLKNVENAVFSARNLIIGENGSGKTRFLKTLEQEKKNRQANKEKVITLYFPEIQAFYKSNVLGTEEVEENEEEIYPYDLLLGEEDSSFFDFLKVIEKDKTAFLTNMMSTLTMKGTRKNNDAKKILKDLNILLSDFIGKEIFIDQTEKQIFVQKGTGECSTRKLPLEEALEEFSPGELMLFYICVFLKLVERKYSKGLILIIDEPELHLHPRALVKMIQRLRKSKSVSELWIASHSLFLVPLFEFEEIVFLKQDTVHCRNSHLYNELYDSLVGLENINLFEFLKSIDNWQYYQFIAECFCLPEAVDKVSVHDEQFQKLAESIKHNMQGEAIQMLDYGAGKCRIWECMQLLPDNDMVKDSVEYTAYEPYPEINMKKMDFRAYEKFEDIRTEKRKFQVIVLMNVLHEIQIDQWYETFENIRSVLMDNGILIFLEVLSLTKGEQPYGDTGYLVLQDEQVKILFDASDIINVRMNAKEKSNCWILTKNQVNKVTENTIQKSIENLREKSYEALKIAFDEKIKFAHESEDKQKKQIAARKYAFLSQQYINAELTLSFLRDGKATKSDLVDKVQGAQEDTGESKSHRYSAVCYINQDNQENTRKPRVLGVKPEFR